MLVDIKTINLVKLKSNLEECLLTCPKVFEEEYKSALSMTKMLLKRKAELISVPSAAAKDEMEHDSFLRPESFYNIRYLDKGLSIVFNNMKINEKSGLNVRCTNSYHIKCFNWCPSFASDKIKSRSVFVSANFGEYSTLSEALIIFPKYIKDFMSVVMNYKMDQDLF